MLLIKIIISILKNIQDQKHKIIYKLTKSNSQSKKVNKKYFDKKLLIGR